jgi:hypothetical protein
MCFFHNGANQHIGGAESNFSTPPMCVSTFRSGFVIRTNAREQQQTLCKQ